MTEPGATGQRGGQQQVSFVSDAFPRCEEDDMQVNRDRWGHRAADYLRGELAARGLQAHGPVGEDWGWALSVMHGKNMYLVGCGIVHGEENMFLVILDPIRPFLSLFGKKPDPTPVASAIDDILRSNPDIRDIEWEPGN